MQSIGSRNPSDFVCQHQRSHSVIFAITAQSYAQVGVSIHDSDCALWTVPIGFGLTKSANRQLG